MKKVLIGFAVILVLLIGTLLIAPGFIDWSGYRADISKQVKQATGRDMIIGGQISFSLLPSPVLHVSDIRLSNAPNASTADMVVMRQLDVRVALLPLLGGQLHIQSIRMIQPTVQLEILPNGRGNWELQSAQQQPATSMPSRAQRNDPAFTDQQAKTDQSLPLQIDDFIIEQGRLVFTNPKENLHEEISEINTRFAVAALNGPFEAAGTLKLRDIPIGFEGSVGQIVNGRTASFSTELRFAHGKTLSRLSGTLINLADGPKIKGKVAVNGESLAGFLSAFQQAATLPGGLDRAFSIEGEIAYSPREITLGENGFSLTLGDDHATVLAEYKTNDTLKDVTLKANFTKIDGDIWLKSPPYKVIAPQPLQQVIKLSTNLASPNGTKVSASLGQENTSPQKTASTVQATGLHALPSDINANMSVNIDALLLKGSAIRQVKLQASLEKGEVALERLSALLPGAGEAALIGVAGERNKNLQFDGSLEVNFAHLRGLLDWLDIDASSVPAERLQQLSFNSQIAATPKEIRLFDTLVQMDATTLKGASTIALRTRPSFGTSLTVDRINADAYLGSASSALTKPSLKTSTAQKTGTAPTADTSGTTSTLPAVLETLKILDTFDANLNLALKHLTYQKQDIKNVSLNATIYNGDLMIKQASIGNLAGVQVGAKGALKKNDKGIQAENLNLSLNGKNLSQAAALAGLADSLNWQKFGSLDLSATLNGNLLAPDLDINANALGGNIIVSASTDLLPLPKADASVNLQFKDIRNITRGLSLSYQPAGNPGALDLAGDIAFSMNKVSLNNVSGHLGNSAIKAQATYQQAARPVLNAEMEVSQLALDPLMPNNTTNTQTSSKKAANNNRSSAKSNTGASVSGSEKWSREKIDLSALQNMDGTVRFKANRLTYNKAAYDNVIAQADLKNAQLNITQLSANMFGGQANINGVLNAAQTPTLNATLSANALQLAPLLAQGKKGIGATGTIDLRGEINTKGNSQYDMVRQLNGNTRLSMQKVAINKKGNKASALDVLNFLAVLSGSDPAKGLADISLTSTITNGVANLDSTSLVSPIASGTAKGNVDIAAWSADISGQLDMKQNALLGLLAQKTKMKSSYPFAVTGSLDAPNVKLDTGGISSGGGLIIPLPEKLEKKGVGTLLRGLLGAGGIQTEAPAQEQPQQTGGSTDGTLAPPPPPPGSSNTTNTQSPAPSVEQQLLQGLGNLLRKK